jgi:hypothetical protein
MLARGLQDSKHIPILSQVACECQNPFCDARKGLASVKIGLGWFASGLQIQKYILWS